MKQTATVHCDSVAAAVADVAALADAERDAASQSDARNYNQNNAGNQR